MTDIRWIRDREEWDRLLLAFPHCDLRQSHAWGEIRRRQGWEPLRVAAFNGAGCVVALSLYLRRVPGVGTIAYAPRGPVMDFASEHAWAALPRLVGWAGRVVEAAFVRVSPALGCAEATALSQLATAGFVALPDFWSLWNTPRSIMRLDLAGSERDVLARMAKKRRQHITTAPQHGIDVEWGTGLDSLRSFYTLLKDHAERLRYPVRDWSYFEAVYEAFAPDRALALIYGRRQGEIVCARLGVRFGAVAYALYAPSTPAVRGTAAGEAVHWEWIRWARAADCREIDFGGSGTYVPPRETEANYGIYRFKAELGCRLELTAPYHDYVFSSLRYRMFRVIEQRAMFPARVWLGRLSPRVRAAITRCAA